jgi:hypothetical protein
MEIFFANHPVRRRKWIVRVLLRLQASPQNSYTPYIPSGDGRRGINGHISNIEV